MSVLLYELMVGALPFDVAALRKAGMEKLLREGLDSGALTFVVGAREAVVEAERGTSNVYEVKLPATVDGAWHPGEDGRFSADTVSLWQDERYFADFQGGARRLSNGNTLLTDTTDYLVVEIDAEGNIVAEYQGAAPVYKAFKYNVADFPDFLGRFSSR